MPGIVESVYLGAANISRGPGSLTDERQYARTDQRLRSGALATHYAQPASGDPDLIYKHRWSLNWERLSDSDVLAITLLVGTAGSFDFCPWRPDAEAWTFAAGASYAGTLLRRNAIDVISAPYLPTGYASKYAHAGLLNGATKTITLGSITDYRTAWTATGTASAGDIVSVTYYPVYRVKVTDEQPSYGAPHVQGWRLVLEEL
jgi:hypothetical protein